MAVDVGQNLSNVERLQKELADEVAGLPGALHSYTPELLVDYLAATFKEGDNDPKSWSAAPCTALKEEEEGKWGTLAAMMQEGPSCSKVLEEAAAMDAAAERIQATILETERTSVAPVEEMGLPAGEEDDKGLLLVRCKTCARVLLAGSLAAHEEQCRSAPVPFRPAASPAPSSTTASMPASSGPASISQGKPAPARRKKAASVPKSKLGPGKKQGAAEAGKALQCSNAARQVAQVMRPPLYPGPAKVLVGQQQQLAPQHMAPRFPPEARNRPGSTSGMGVPQPANSRHPAQHGVATNGGVPNSHQWASLQIPHNFPGGGFDDLSLDWLDDPGGMLVPNASSAQLKARSAPAKPAQSRGAALIAPQAPKRRKPSDNSNGPFLPHPRRLRSAHPKRRLARMLTLPHVSTESPGRVIPMPTPQKQRASGNGRPAPQRQNLPSSNGPVAATQQQTLQQQKLHHHQQMAWQMANPRAQQQPSQQAQRQTALRQPALHQPSAQQSATWQQQQQRHQHQLQHTHQQQRAVAPNSGPRPQSSPHSLVQQWAGNGMQVIPPGAYLLPQHLPAGGARTSYMVPHMQPQTSTAQHTNSQSSAQHMPSTLGYQQAQQPQASTAKNTYSQSTALHMPGSLGYQQTQQPQRHPHHQQQQQQQQQYYQQMQHGGRMVPMHDAQQRVAQSTAQNGQTGVQHMQRVSMQRLMPDNFVPVSALGCTDGGAQRVEAVNALKRSYSGDPRMLPPTKKLASLQHQTLPMLLPEEFKPF